jgi:hypothetical protein
LIYRAKLRVAHGLRPVDKVRPYQRIDFAQQGCDTRRSGSASEVDAGGFDMCSFLSGGGDSGAAVLFRGKYLVLDVLHLHI